MNQIDNLKKRLILEFEKQDRSGIYGETQKKLAYNSNRIEGSSLTYNQTISIFETATISSEEDLVKTKDIEEMNGHFLMFNEMIQTCDLILTEELIKKYHYDLKFGVFEDKANGYPVGEYKIRKNKVGSIETTAPELVSKEMHTLLDWYNSKKVITLEEIALFHYKYEKIHPFQDGNGRTGRIIMFKECLKNNIFPFIVEEVHKAKYYKALQNSSEEDVSMFISFFQDEQKEYKKQVEYFLGE